MVCKTCIKRAEGAYIFKRNLQKTEFWLNSNIDKLKVRENVADVSKIPKIMEGKDDLKVIHNWLQSKVSKLETKNISKLNKNTSLDAQILPSIDMQNTEQNTVKSPEKLIPVYIIKMKKEETKTPLEEHDKEVVKNLKEMKPGSPKKSINKLVSKQRAVAENTNIVVDILINEKSSENQQINIGNDLKEMKPESSNKKNISIEIDSSSDSEVEDTNISNEKSSENNQQINIGNGLKEMKPGSSNKENISIEIDSSSDSDVEETNIPNKKSAIKHNKKIVTRKNLKASKTGSSIKNDDSKKIKKKSPNWGRNKLIKTFQSSFTRTIKPIKKIKIVPDCLMDHDYELVYCKICDQDYPNKYSYNNHRRVHTTSKCKLCDKAFSTPTILKNHMKSHAAKGKIFVRDEPSIVTYPFKMTSKRERIYKCELCDKLFVQILALFRHMRDKHVQNDQFGCNICGDGCANREELLTHILCHDASPYSCAHCPEKFSTVLAVSLHVKNHNNEPDVNINAKIEPDFPFVLNENNERVYPCSECDKKYNSKSNLKVHYKIHLGHTVLCQICGKTFNTHLKLDIHMNTHSDVKRYECDVCGKKFKQQSGLYDHKLYHTQNYPYCCEICGKRYRKRTPLETHLKSHNNQRDFECVPCKKRFYTRTYLNNHMRTHNRVNKFSCSLCSKQFFNKSSCKYHEKRHREIKDKQTPKCFICEKTFSVPESLKQHMKLHRFV